MIIDDFKTKPLHFLRAWSVAVESRIAQGGANYREIEAHCSVLLEAQQLPKPKGTIKNEIAQTLSRISGRGRIVYDRKTHMWGRV